MHDIHLIEKTMSFRQADDGSGDWITGDWRLFPSEIEKITGGNVLLHQTQKSGCRLGGKILEINHIDLEKHKVEIRFCLDRELVQKVANGNWQPEKLIVERMPKAA